MTQENFLMLYTAKGLIFAPAQIISTIVCMHCLKVLSTLFFFFLFLPLYIKKCGNKDLGCQMKENQALQYVTLQILSRATPSLAGLLSPAQEQMLLGQQQLRGAFPKSCSPSEHQQKYWEWNRWSPLKANKSTSKGNQSGEDESCCQMQDVSEGQEGKSTVLEKFKAEKCLESRWLKNSLNAYFWPLQKRD